MAEGSPLPVKTESDSLPSEIPLPPTPYGYEQLEPYISARAMTIHHGKHHARYVAQVNGILAAQQITERSLERILRAAYQDGARALFNNAAQAWNHAFFWESMSSSRWRPGGQLANAITSTFGSFERLGQRFVAEGKRHFGSGWVWLMAHRSELSIITTHDAATPIVDEALTPLLACDVWEHAYYLDYTHDRADWLVVWWERLANWQFAERQYSAALGSGQIWQFPTFTAPVN
ncbi:MAG: superoxide dismutase [Novosphingobium sp.]|nr:superoxide dismutase [Alphaproteobacteria bacterium]MCP5403757.1 superoxide dismutase [Novosphingobium sp.]